jgi:molecular chaperone GrpE
MDESKHKCGADCNCGGGKFNETHFRGGGGKGCEGECNAHDKKPEKPDGAECSAKSAVDWESIAKYKAAELDNYIKRNKDTVSNAFNEGRTAAAMKIVPLVDALGEAIKSVQTETDRKGIEILTRKFENVLGDLGIEEIAVKKGDKFDPHIHHAINEGAEDGQQKVVEVYQKGYKFAGRTIRAALVKI